jgi:hypothetical protein
MNSDINFDVFVKRKFDTTDRSSFHSSPVAIIKHHWYSISFVVIGHINPRVVRTFPIRSINIWRLRRESQLFE